MKVEKMVTDDPVNGEQSEEDDVFLTPDSVVGSGPVETPLKVSKVGDCSILTGLVEWILY